MLLRIAYTAAAWEGQDSAEDVVIAELSLTNGLPDLSPSAYQVDNAASVVRACVEHRANAGMPAPAKRSAGVDLEGLGYVTGLSRLAGAPFSFCADRHHVFTLPDRAALLQLVTDALADQARNHPAPLGEMKEYVRERVRVNDAEWTAFLRTELGEEWRAELRLPAAV